jgi:hypothetical protein
VEPAGESDSESECMGLARFAFRPWGQLQKEPSIAAVQHFVSIVGAEAPAIRSLTPSGALYPSQLICHSTDKVVLDCHCVELGELRRGTIVTRRVKHESVTERWSGLSVTKRRVPERRIVVSGRT